MVQASKPSLLGTHPEVSLESADQWEVGHAGPVVAVHVGLEVVARVDLEEAGLGWVVEVAAAGLAVDRVCLVSICHCRVLEAHHTAISFHLRFQWV